MITNNYESIIKKKPKLPLLFCCDHASNLIPNEYNKLGLNNSILKSHIAYDIGAKKLTNHELGGRRQLLMLAHLKLFLNNPIIGVGIGQSNERLDKNKIGTSVGSAHNTQIRTLAENGIIGFILLSIF